MKKLLSFFKIAFLQFLPIAVGVYVGIVAGNWNEDRKNKKDQEEFLNNVKDELQNNLKRIDYSIKYHEELKIELDSLLNTMDEETLYGKFFENEGFQILPNWTGTGVATLSTTTFQTGLNSNIFADLSFKKSRVLSSIYNYMDNYKQFTDPIMERMLYDLNYETKTMEVIFVMELLCSDVLGFEKRMKEGINQAIENL